jgi:hypothetical protein
VINGWWEWPPATITRVIAVTPLEKQRDASKNRSHNPKTTNTKLQSFFFDQTERFSGQRSATVLVYRK